MFIGRWPQFAGLAFLTQGLFAEKDKRQCLSNQEPPLPAF
jgi:hypothetical protein